MPAPSTYVLNDFSGGVQSANANPLAWPKNAIWDGRDFIIKNKGLQTRKGYKEVCDFGTGLPVTLMRQVFFPTPGQPYLLVVAEDTGATKFKVSVTSLPSDALTFSDAYVFADTDKLPEIDTLGDRAIIVEPTTVPLVFSGCLSATGADWAVPKQVMFSPEGINFTDISQVLCDADSDTKFTVGTLNSVAIGDTTPGTGAVTTGYTYIAKIPLTNNTYLTQVGYYTAITSSGSVKIKICKVNGSNYDVTDLQTFTRTSAGLQTYTLSTPYLVPNDSGVYYVGIYVSAYNVGDLNVATSGGIGVSYKTGDLSGVNISGWAELGTYRLSLNLTIDGDSVIDICCDAESVEGIYFQLETVNTQTASIAIQRRSGGAWVAINDWTDNTAITGKTLAQSGTIAGTVKTSELYTEAQVPGHWYRLTFPDGLFASTAISRILVKMPCQKLSNLGDGQPDIAAAILYYIAAQRIINDFTVSLSDYELTTQPLNDGNLDSPQGMKPTDYIYIGYPEKFNQITPELYPNCNNQVVSSLMAEYYSRGSWKALSITDNTEVIGKTLSRSGPIDWTVPSDWEECIPLSGAWPMAYWVRFRVSAQLSSTVELSELHLMPVEKTLKKHNHIFRFRDRLVMVGRPDQPAEVDISRVQEEYGWCGSDSWEDVMAGSDAVIAAIEAFNQGWLFRSRDLYMLNGYNPDTFSLERAEIAGRCPINSRVLLKAPLLEADDKAKMGFYFLSHEGAYHFTGLQLYDISEQVPWFLSTTAPCLDHENLHNACGAYLPAHRWVVWAVPMKFGVSAQTTNNCLLIYDLAYRIWYPPVLIPAASLCVARDTISAAPGKAGRERLYVGTYGGKILELFGETDDHGIAINPWLETGWINFEMPGIPKRINSVTIYGYTGTTSLTLKLYIDGNESEYETLDCSDNLPPGVLFAVDCEKSNIKAYFAKLRLDATGPTDIHAVDFEISVPPEK